MKILAATTAGAGHFGPMLPFARAWQAAGHVVHVGSSAAAQVGDAVRKIVESTEMRRVALDVAAEIATLPAASTSRPDFVIERVYD